MQKKTKKIEGELLVGVDTIKKDYGVSTARAYQIIRDLNKKMKEENPLAIIINGKVNREWYERASNKR